MKLLILTCVVAIVSLIIIVKLQKTYKVKVKPVIPKELFQAQQMTHKTYTKHSVNRPKVRLPSCHEYMTYLENAVIQGKDEQKFEALIKIGDLYLRGFYPQYAPHDMMSRECFRIASKCPFPIVAATAEGKLTESHTNPIRSIDRSSGAALPSQYGQRACAHCTKALPALTAQSVQRQILHELHRQREQQQNQPIITAEPQPLVPMQTMHIVRPVRRRHVQTPRPMLLDLQNSHDSAVVAAVKTNVQKLVDLEHGPAYEDVVDQVSEMIQFSPDISQNELIDAQRVLRSLTTFTHGTFNTNEKSALQLVWNRIQSVDDPQVRINLIEQLGKQLASGVERDKVVCSTGKLTRIISTLDGTDQALTQTVRPLDMVKQELASLAAKIRTEQLGSYNDEQKKQYDLGNDTHATERMKQEFANQAKQTYVKDLKMHESQIGPLIKVYAEEF